MVEPTSISQNIYKMIQEHAHSLSYKNIREQPQHLDLLESLIIVAKADWKIKNPNYVEEVKG